MTDPGYGSYLASAAEKERDRRAEGQQLLKKLDMQKYGIDTQASTSRYATDSAASTADKNREVRREELQSLNERSQRDFDEQVRQFGLQDDRQQTLFDLKMKDRATSEEIAGNIVTNAAEVERSNVQREALLEDDADHWFPNLRAGDVEADQYSGVGGRIKKWWRDEGFFGEGDSAYDPKYNLTVGGERIDPQLQQLDLTDNDMTLEMLQAYTPGIGTADSIGKGQSTEALKNNVWNLWGLMGN